MSFLAPLYIAGLLTVSLPIVFHLIRRTPRGRTLFSSLMFLSPSPPRLSRRSRLDNLLLLLLRATALVLLAIAFARPFLREASKTLFDDMPGRRIAILLDTSASMQRGNSWQQATASVEQLLREMEPSDEVGLFAFDDRPRTVVEFPSDASVSTDVRRQLVRSRMKELRPSWSRTNLGHAIVHLAELLDSMTEADSLLQNQIVLVSDMQLGAALDALEGYSWPDAVRVDVRRVKLAQPTNAFARLLASNQEQTDSDPRVRVTNVSDSYNEQFHIAWGSSVRSQLSKDAVDIVVPIGQSRVFRLPKRRSDSAADRIVLMGDDAPFDNAYFVGPVNESTLSVAYVGEDEADDPDGLRYYFTKALEAAPHFDIHVLGSEVLVQEGGAEANPPRLVIATGPATGDQVNRLTSIVRDGGALLVVPKTEEALDSFGPLLGPVDVEPPSGEARRASYAMLGEIDFGHPIFATFSNPSYSDFTSIYFWKRRNVSLSDESAIDVIARFDDGKPAFWEKQLGDGTVYVLASGWHPDDSQFALSSKFVPFLTSVVDVAANLPTDVPRYEVDDRVLLDELNTNAAPMFITNPDGKTTPLAEDAVYFDGTATPGVYEVQFDDDSTARFAVNVSATESKTNPMNIELLEQFGIVLGSQPVGSEQLERARQKRDTELENTQKIWRWLIALALCVLVVETGIAGKVGIRRAEMENT